MSIRYTPAWPIIPTKPLPHKPQQPYKPSRYEYIGIGGNDCNIIYRDIESNEIEFSWDEYCRDQSVVAPLSEKRHHENLTLQDIVDLAPAGARLSDIKLHIEFHVDHAAEITFVHQERNIEAEESAFAEAMARFEKECAEYEVKLAAYEKALKDRYTEAKQAHIAELEKQLARLKGNS